MTRMITLDELSTTATDRLAAAIGLYRRLSIGDVEDITDAGLALADDFTLMGDPWIAGDGTPAYGYSGDRWTVEFRCGRPHLIEAITVPNDVASEVDRAEAAFGICIDLVERLFGHPVDAQRIAELKRETWGEVFEQATERDAEPTAAHPPAGQTDCHDCDGR